MRPPFWSRAWKTAPWIRRLSGTTLPPSTAARGAASWIASLRDFRVSRGVPRVSNSAPKTIDGYGPRLSASFAMWDPNGYFSRTSLDLFQEADSNSYSGIFPYSGSMRNGCLYRREMSVPRIEGSESSSWPTATRQDSASSGANYPKTESHNPGVTLTEAVREWATPQSHDSVGGKTPEQIQAMRERTGAGVMNLNEMAANWSTPSAYDGRRPGSEDDSTQGRNLKREAEIWQTPSVADTTGGRLNRSGKRGSELLLKGQASLWATATAHERSLSPRSVHHGEQLANQVDQWPTPRCGAHGTPGHGLRHPTIENAGVQSLPNTQSSRRRLNALFVEWLMGFPPGWTDFVPLETASFLSWRRRHGGS
jgi:hypothetical protein